MPDLFEGVSPVVKVAAVGVALIALGLVLVVLKGSERLAAADARAEAEHAAQVAGQRWPFETGARVSSPLEGLGVVADVPRLPGLIPVRFDADPGVVRWLFPVDLLAITPSDEDLLRRVEDRGREAWRATHEQQPPSASTPPPPPTPTPSTNGAHAAPGCCGDHDPIPCRHLGPCCGACPTVPTH